MLTAPVEVCARLLLISFWLNRSPGALMRLPDDRRRFNRVFCLFVRQFFALPP